MFTQPGLDELSRRLDGMVEKDPERGVYRAKRDMFSDEELFVDKFNFANVLETRMGGRSKGTDADKPEATENNAETKFAFGRAEQIWHVSEDRMPSNSVSQDGAIIAKDPQRL